MYIPVINKKTHINHSPIATRSFLSYAKPSVVIDYLKASHWRYENEIIPRIEQSFVGLIKLFPQIPSLPVIFNLFIKFELAMKIHMSIEEKKFYKDYLSHSTSNKEQDHMSHEDEEPFLNEIMLLLQKEQCSENPFCRILIQQLETFEEELIEHAWIEEHIVNKKLQES